jgi:ribosome-associated heat shock protein Hsp15
LLWDVTSPETPEACRIDKWLWCVRVFRSRALATDACRAGSVDLNGQAAKPSRDVRPGDEVVVRFGLLTRTLRVTGVPRARLGAALVPTVCDDLTPASEKEKPKRDALGHFLAREKGSGRPTKRDRRLLDRLLES